VKRAKRLELQIRTLSLAMKDPGTPWIARIVAMAAIAYALSPIDLIPDFIPILGQLDDLIIVPGLIALALRFIPRDVLARCRRQAWKKLAPGRKMSNESRR
jgi:uncharacterized membrane protein YkvA (DUF1232 family)